MWCFWALDRKRDWVDAIQRHKTQDFAACTETKIQSLENQYGEFRDLFSLSHIKNMKILWNMEHVREQVFIEWIPGWTPAGIHSFFYFTDVKWMNTWHMWIPGISTKESVAEPLHSSAGWQEHGKRGGFQKEKRGRRKSSSSDHRFWFGVLLEAEGSPLEHEVERWCGEAGEDRKGMELEE